MDKDKFINWALFIGLCIIWGSSFLLMKIGLQSLSSVHVASLRILSGGIVVLPFIRNALKTIEKEKIPLFLLSGTLGSFLPAFLFCLAETKLTSSTTGILNSFTPLFTILIGTTIFSVHITRQKIFGILIGLIGLICLVSLGGSFISQNIGYISLALLATVFYGININIVSGFMKGVTSLKIAAVSIGPLSILSFFLLLNTQFFEIPFHTSAVQESIEAALGLGIFGTGLATIMFYKLVKRTGTVFSSMVTYGVPIVAVIWGFILGEPISFLQIGCVLIIFSGIYIAGAYKMQTTIGGGRKRKLKHKNGSFLR